MAFTLFTGVDFPASGVNDAWFRTFQGISDAFTAVGFPKTTDTGQVDWATVSLPAEGTGSAFEVRVFTGALVAAPVHVRIGYFWLGTQAFLSVQLGTGSDGAGNITGAVTTDPGDSEVSTLCETNASDSSDTGKTAWAMSCDDYGFALISGGSPAVNRFFLSVEALRADDGTPLSGQMAVLGSSGQSLGDCAGSRFDLVNRTMQTYRGLPISYFDKVTAAGQSSNYSQSYYFSAPVLLTPVGIGRTKLLIGLNQNDFIPGALLQVPRFGETDPTPYLYYKPESGPGGFGSPDYAYCAPALYWA